jgi:hypothetical protein
LVEVGRVGQLINVPVILLPVLEEEHNGADEKREGHEDQDDLLDADLLDAIGEARGKLGQRVAVVDLSGGDAAGRGEL